MPAGLSPLGFVAGGVHGSRAKEWAFLPPCSRATLLKVLRRRQGCVESWCSEYVEVVVPTQPRQTTRGVSMGTGSHVQNKNSQAGKGENTKLSWEGSRTSELVFERRG